MDRKSTYEKLAQRNKDLEKAVVNSKRTEQALRECEKRFKNVTNSIEELLVFVDRNFKIQLINSTLAQAWNISLDEYKGKRCYELFYGCNDICEGCPAIQVLDEGKVIRNALRYRPDGRIYERSAYPFFEDNGNITGVIVIGCDITDQKQAEEKLRESERKYSDLVQESPDAIISVDKTGNLLSFNPAAERMSGFSAEQVMGKHFAKIGVLSKQSMSKALKEFALVIKGIKRPPFELTVMRKDKSYLIMEANPRLIKQKVEKAWVQAIFRDITDRKRAEEALRVSEKKYRNLLETTSQGYLMLNPELKNIEVNPSLCKLLGYGPDEILGKTPFDFVDDENRKIFIDQLSKIPVKTYRSYEVTMKKKNGQNVNAYVNATTIRDESGEVQGAFALLTDITHMKQTEQRLKQREKELEIKNIRLKEMNSALKILLEKRDEDKKELEEKVMTNIKELVLPYILKLKNTGLNQRQEIYADIIQSHIEEIVSPFAQKLSHKYLNFTPTELKVAHLVKQGLRTKDIAKLLGSSPETITRHRKSMRKKLKLTDKKSNLRTHLLSLANGHIE